MLYACKTEHCKSGETNVFSTSYDYTPGTIIYPINLRDKYPGKNENRHRVIVCIPLEKLTSSQILRLFGQASV